MGRRPEKYLFDAIKASETISGFLKDKTYSDYLNDELLRSGVERKLIIIGEALNQLSKVAPDMALKISNFQKIVGFRNFVVHGYDLVEDATVWGIIKSHIPTLHKELELLLKESGGALWRG